LAVGATKVLTITFAPSVAGAASGSISVTSNATNPRLSIPLSGTGVAIVQHLVTLSWTASKSQVAGYKVYRATDSNGPFTVLNTGLITATSYVDHAVTSNATYYYFATAVDSKGDQSVASNHVSATVP
jgi:fibronectin type 3 domain-containing protein